jgi:2-amino-4-hydroxy-6-hydroxymethyldihydropteridine diphosphokinase
METLLIGFGGNLISPVGSPQQTIIAAAGHLQRQGIDDLRMSGWFQSTPVPATGQPDFCNTVAVAQAELSPKALLELFQETETRFGRRPAERWSARTLDIDLLAYGAEVLPSLDAWWAVVNDPDPAAILNEPVVPHPRLHKRAFVLKPLASLLPTWVHPVTGQSLEDLCKASEVVEQWETVVEKTEFSA